MPLKIVVGEIERHLLRARNVGGNLHRECRAVRVLVWPATSRLFIENLRELRRVSAADGEENGLAYFPRQRIALGIIEETADKTQICFVGEELSLVILLAKYELGFLSIFIRRNSHRVAFI